MATFARQSLGEARDCDFKHLAIIFTPHSVRTLIRVVVATHLLILAVEHVIFAHPLSWLQLGELKVAKVSRHVALVESETDTGFVF